MFVFFKIKDSKLLLDNEIEESSLKKMLKVPVSQSLYKTNILIPKRL